MQSEERGGVAGYYRIVITVGGSFLLLTVIYEILKLFLTKHTVTGIVLESTFGITFTSPFD